MIVQVDWYRADTGKWYSGGEVDVGGAQLWRSDYSWVDGHQYNEITIAIGLNQQIMQKGCCSGGSYIIVVRNLPEWDVKTEFCQRLFWAKDFPPGL